MADTEVLSNVISVIDNNTKKPEQFLSIQNKAALDFKNSIKCLYDFTKEQSGRNTNALPELVTEGFDEEQIWQQLELQNEGELVHFITGVSRVLTENKKLTIPISATKPEMVQSTEEIVSDDKDNVEEENVSEEDDSEDEIAPKSPLKKQKKKSSIVDDKFFKLQELDEYLTKEEKKEKQIVKDEQGSDEESVDLFNNYSDNDEGDSGEKKLLKYADFFDSPQSEDEDANNSMRHKDINNKDIDNNSLHDDSDNAMDTDDEQNERKSSQKKVTFNLTNDSDDTDSLENRMVSRKEETEVKSALETRQERLNKRIQELEEAALAEKPWQLKGEVGAANRPQNSLLEEFVEFDITTRPPPVITEQTTVKLEDIIKQRIKDKAWDDVEKKFKPVETPMEYKKKLILDQEKSKESLSQIYENEYLKQKQALNPDSEEKEEEEPKLHIEIREMMHSVFLKLDALSNFHYTPKPAKPEIKVVTNIPAINMEEVAPLATSDAALLAPEEIKEKQRGDLIGKGERTKTDMKRERRHKKMRQRARQEAMEKKEKQNALKPGIEKKYKKGKTLKELAKKLSNSRNVIKMDETGQKVPKSSTAFFNQLQDQVKGHIKSKISANSKKKRKDAVSAIKLKL
ncbi:PREDICTED: U3 small nucleolar ribonucleoprotein protein MPP10 [Dufourea novaeangliae]|uniref:U3 small nucleolar ribonucleoprotein protein MPP10 n=1 Tax=Dufourea novaeangliae TaxID=178035 RepID=A0A154P7X8_DUFNO|nr:PREDICTED: U3 small nucleolar ribonucleoprotein protein MPP10 [Dufourea novaeangliae]KZC07977.1 U3 small nucleolar ribonucleoprotein MPP10 [Dufourea novaeangliae]